MTESGPMAAVIESKLREGLAPEYLEIRDDSAAHQGHSGWREGGESHFDVVIVSQQFEGKSRVSRQRMVFALLKEEMTGQIHALSLQCKTPDEASIDAKG